MTFRIIRQADQDSFLSAGRCASWCSP